MVGRFFGEGGRRLRVDALASQKIVAGNRELRKSWPTLWRFSPSRLAKL
jgi:hypothetical protein